MAMAAASTNGKSLTWGKFGPAIALTLLAFTAFIIAGKACNSAYAFHALLFAAASGFAVFKIVERYQTRPAELPLLTIDGKPNDNYGLSRLVRSIARRVELRRAIRQ
jgi:cytochrome c oxidase cbb3-type subunit 1